MTIPLEDIPPARPLTREHFNRAMEAMRGPCALRPWTILLSRTQIQHRQHADEPLDGYTKCPSCERYVDPVAWSDENQCQPTTF